MDDSTPLHDTEQRAALSNLGQADTGDLQTYQVVLQGKADKNAVRRGGHKLRPLFPALPLDPAALGAALLPIPLDQQEVPAVSDGVQPVLLPSEQSVHLLHKAIAQHRHIAGPLVEQSLQAGKHRIGPQLQIVLDHYAAVPPRPHSLGELLVAGVLRNILEVQVLHIKVEQDVEQALDASPGSQGVEE